MSAGCVKMLLFAKVLAAKPLQGVKDKRVIKPILLLFK